MSEISQAKSPAWDALRMNEIAAQDDLPAFLDLALSLDLSGCDQNGRSLLHLFCHYKAIRCATYVFLMVPDLASKQDVMREIPLHRACYGKKYPCL